MVAASDLAVGGDGVAGAVGVLDDAPAEPVDEVVVVGKAVQVQVPQGCRAAVGPGLMVVWLAPAGGLVASAGPLAVLVAEDDGAAQVTGDVVGVPDVQDEAGAGERPAEEAGAQEPGEAAGAGQGADGQGEQGAFQGEPGGGGQWPVQAVGWRAVAAA